MPDSTPEPTPEPTSDLRVNLRPHLTPEPSPTPEPVATDHSVSSGVSGSGPHGNGAAFERAACAWNNALLETQARQNHTVLPSREWFSRLPAINRGLIGAGIAFLLMGLFCLLGVPLLSPRRASPVSSACLSSRQPEPVWEQRPIPIPKKADAIHACLDCSG